MISLDHWRRRAVARAAVERLSKCRAAAAAIGDRNFPPRLRVALAIVIASLLLLQEAPAARAAKILSNQAELVCGFPVTEDRLTIDRSFGEEGIAKFEGPLRSIGYNSMQVDSNERIVLVGQMPDSAGTLTVASARLLPHGVLDPDFGMGGLVTISAPKGWQFYSQASVLSAIDPQRRIVIAAPLQPVTPAQTEPATPQRSGLLIARLLDDGSLDPAFGRGGLVVEPPAGRGLGPTNLGVAPNGAIVVTTISGRPGPPRGAFYEADFDLWHYDADGTLMEHLDLSQRADELGYRGGVSHLLAMDPDGSAWLLGLYLGKEPFPDRENAGGLFDNDNRSVLHLHHLRLGMLTSFTASDGLQLRDRTYTVLPRGLRVLRSGQLMLSGDRYARGAIFTFPEGGLYEPYMGSRLLWLDRTVDGEAMADTAQRLDFDPLPCDAHMIGLKLEDRARHLGYWSGIMTTYPSNEPSYSVLRSRLSPADPSYSPTLDLNESAGTSGQGTPRLRLTLLQVEGADLSGLFLSQGKHGLLLHVRSLTSQQPRSVAPPWNGLMRVRWSYAP